MPNLLKQIFGGIGKVAAIAAPFLPGPWGPIAGIAGGLLAGGQDSEKASGYTGQISGLGEQQAQIAGYQPALIKALMQNAGFNPATGTYDPNYNPNAASADTLFNPNSLNGMFVAGQEAGAPAYDNAVNSVRADFLRRGFGGGENSGYNTAVANIRTAQGQDNANARRGLLYNLANQKRQYLINGQTTARADLNNALGASTGASQGALGTLGGLQGYYANRASQNQQGIQQAIGQISQSGIFGDTSDKINSWLKGRFGLGNRRQPAGVGTPPYRQTLGGKPALSGISL